MAEVWQWLFSMVYGSANVQVLPHTLQSIMFQIIKMLLIVCSLLLRVITTRHFVVYFSSLFISSNVHQHLLLSMMLVFKVPKIEYKHREDVSLLGGLTAFHHKFLRVRVESFHHRNNNYTIERILVPYSILLKASSCQYTRHCIFSPLNNLLKW